MTDQTAASDRRIVVGVDSSPNSKTALRWAVAQARLTGAGIEAVAAWQEPVMAGDASGWTPVVYDGDSLAVITEKILAETVADVVEQQSEPVDIATRVVQGHPAQVLLEAADGAQMLVLGSRGHGTFTGILLGSVSQHCVQHAPCPVVVVPPNPTQSR
jgi:nucleotide-binding universal stress UspA family protein